MVGLSDFETAWESPPVLHCKRPIWIWPNSVNLYASFKDPLNQYTAVFKVKVTPLNSPCYILFFPLIMPQIKSLSKLQIVPPKRIHQKQQWSGNIIVCISLSAHTSKRKCSGILANRLYYKILYLPISSHWMHLKLHSNYLKAVLQIIFLFDITGVISSISHV